MKISNNLLFCNQIFDDTKEICPAVVNLNNVNFIGVRTDCEDIEYISINFTNGSKIKVKPNGDVSDFFIELAKHCNVCA